MAKRKTEQYRGVLGRPLTPDVLQSYAGAEQLLDDLDRTLMQELGIDPDDEQKWQRLARALSFAHVRAYRFDEPFVGWMRSYKRKGGRKGVNPVKVVMDVDAKIDELRKNGSPRGYYTKKACVSLTQRGAVYGKLTAPQLRGVYDRNRKAMHRLFAENVLSHARLNNAQRSIRDRRTLRELRRWASPAKYGAPAERSAVARS